MSNMEYNIKRIEKLERAIKEFLIHSMVFMSNYPEINMVGCPHCLVKQSDSDSSEIKHTENCVLLKLAKALEETE